MKKPKSKRPPRDPEVMKKAWETRRRNQARRADPLARSMGEAHDEYRKRDRGVATKTLAGEAAKNYAAAAMLEEVKRVPFTSMPEASEGQRASAKMYREAASAMNETLYGDPQPGSFIERYKIVSRYKEYLENLGFTVTYDPF